MASSARRIIMIMLSTALRWPLWGVLAVSRLVVPWRTLFVVYPGDESDVTAYAPDCFVWMRNTWLFRGKPQFAGLQIRKGAKPFFGLVVYVSSTIEEMRNDRILMLEILERLDFLARMLGLEIVALAGQMPSVIKKHKLPVKAPFIDGRMGSAFSVVETVNRVFDKHRLEKTESLLVVVGAGFLAESVLTYLVALDYEVEAVDIVRTRTDALVIDDTHPGIRSRDMPQPVYKVALAWPGFEFVPRLPGYKKQWIPGCMLEAIVATQSSDSLASYHRFRETAREIGITVPLN